MKKLFQKWIFAVVALAFLLTFAISFAVSTRQARLGTALLIGIKLSDTAAQLDSAEANLQRVTRLTEESVLLRARLFAAEWAINPRIGGNSRALDRLLQSLDVDELYAFKGDGTLELSHPPLNPGEESPRLNGEKITPSGLTVTLKDTQLQYAAVPRPDAPGALAVGDNPEHLKAAQAVADIRNFSEGFRIGLKGGVLIARDDDLICDGMLDLKIRNLSRLGFPSPLPADGERFQVELDGTRYLAGILRHGDYTLIGLLPENEAYYRRNLAQSVLVIVYLVLFTLIYGLIAFLLNRIVLSGIDRVCDSLQRITDGDLEEIVNVHNCKEFNLLSDGINSTVGALKSAIAEAARRLENELELAKAIQCSALPRVFPAYPECREFDLCATMTPAREVGGDFYDFFLVDGNHLAFLVADVSEKGIPAALFMMTGKTWLKGLALAGLPPEKVFDEANRMLSLDNPAGMFITVFCGFLELSSGRLTCINAGHNPPLLQRRDGSFEYLKLEPDFILGTLPGITYRAHHLQLHPGDRLFLYTDGVTEAQNNGGGEFGTAALRKTLEEVPADAPAETLITHASLALESFAAGAPQYDDITMLALIYRGRTLTLPAEADRLPELQSFLEANCARVGISEGSISLAHIQVAAEEIFLNIASYAYPGGTGTVEVEFAHLPEKELIRLTFSDNGLPYNPLEAPEPEFAEAVEELTVGGLGIHITRTLAASLAYERSENHNRLTVCIDAAPEDEPEPIS